MKKLVLSLVTLAYFSLLNLSAQNTLRFDGEGYLDNANLGHPYEITKNSKTFNFSNSNSDDILYESSGGFCVNGYPNSLLVGAYGGSTTWTIEIDDGSEINLNSIEFANQFTTCSAFAYSISVEGFKDNVSTGTAVALSVGTASHTTVFNANSNFDEVDKIVITATASSLGSLGIEEIVWSAATATPVQNSDGDINAAGDIAFVAYHDNLDGFSFVLIDDCPNGRSIRFCDDEWDGVSAFASVDGEGEVLWTNNTGSTIAAGTVIDIENADDNGTGIAASIGMATEDEGGFNTANIDELFAFTGTRASPGTFLAFIGDNTGNSLANTGLVDGVTANFIDGEGYYSGTTIFNGTRAAAAATINTSSSNWTFGNFTFPGNVPNLLTGTAFSAASDPVVTLTVSNNNPSEGDGSVTLTATADLAPSADLTVNLSYSGTATGSGTDYTAVTSIVIASGTTSNTGTLNITSDNDAESDETIIIDIDGFSGVTATEGSPNQQTVTIANDDFEFSIKLFLEGPLSGTSMSMDLSEKLPKDPNDAYTGVQAEDAVANLPAEAVDWIEVEIRTGTSAATKVGTNRAGILKADGSVVDKDGNAFTLSQANGTPYYIVIHHRNHLSVMSKDPVVTSSGTYSINFTEAGISHGTGGDINIGGEYAMIAGDVNGDGTVNGDDLTAWRAQNGISFSYGSNDKADLNMDGVINAVDRNELQQKNSVTSSQVPSS